MTDRDTMRNLANLVDQAERAWNDLPMGNFPVRLALIAALDAAHNAFKTAYDRLPEDSPLREMYSEMV